MKFLDTPLFLDPKARQNRQFLAEIFVFLSEHFGARKYKKAEGEFFGSEAGTDRKLLRSSLSIVGWNLDFENLRHETRWAFLKDIASWFITRAKVLCTTP